MTDIDILRALEEQKHAATRIKPTPAPAVKEYLTVAEAARYCSLSESEFRARAKLYNIPHGKALGTSKRLYRKHDLQRAIEWHGFGQGDRIGNSPGPAPILTPRRGRKHGTPEASAAALKSPGKKRGSRSMSSDASSSSQSTVSRLPTRLRSISGGKTT